MKQIKKGEYGYLSYKKKTELLKTILLFTLTFAIFFMGYATTHTKKNLLTIVAVLGCLPASKFAVETIIYFRSKSCSASLRNQILPVLGKLDGYFDLYFTSEKKNFAISHLVVTQNAIIAITEQENVQEKDFAEHLSHLLHIEKITNVTIKLFHDKEKYLQRLQELNQSSVDQGKREDVVSMLFSVSL